MKHQCTTRSRASSVVSLLMVTLLGCAPKTPISLPTPARSGPISVPAGATIAIRTADTIDASASPGQTFGAVVARDVNGADGQPLLPSGCPATLILLQLPGGSSKRQVLELGLASVTLNGNSYLVRNQLEGPGATASGARLGTFLGGVPGTEEPPSARQNEGQRQLTVSGEKLWAPVGSLLTFRLKRSLVLIGSHRQ